MTCFLLENSAVKKLQRPRLCLCAVVGLRAHFRRRDEDDLYFTQPSLNSAGNSELEKSSD